MNIEHSQSYNSDARVSDENICTAIHRSPLNTGKCHLLHIDKFPKSQFEHIYFFTSIQH